MKYFLIFVTIICSEISAENEDFIGFFGKSSKTNGKTHVRPSVKPTEPPIELEPPTESESTPKPWNPITVKPEPEQTWRPITTTTQRPLRPETHPEWTYIRSTTKSTSPTPERTTTSTTTTTAIPTTPPTTTTISTTTTSTTTTTTPTTTTSTTTPTTTTPTTTTTTTTSTTTPTTTTSTTTTSTTTTTTTTTTPKPTTISTTRRPYPEPETPRRTTTTTTPTTTSTSTTPTTTTSTTTPTTTTPTTTTTTTTSTTTPTTTTSTTTTSTTTTTTTTTTPKPTTISTTRRPYPEPETPKQTTTTPTTTTTSTRRTTPEPVPQTTTKPSPPIPQECQSVKCRTGYRCDCINPCPATCKDPDRRTCLKHKTINFCVIGCVCDKGYVLSENGACIPVQNCPNQTNNGQNVCNEICREGKQCICQNPCPPTCDNPDPTPCPTFQCNPGCYTVCKRGYVFDKIDGDCIPMQYCPNRQCISPLSSQRENEVFYECSTRYCNRTCNNPNIFCTGQCIKPGNMDCKPGHVRDLRTGKCVLPQQCNQTLLCERRDEVFYECSTRFCQRTCQRPNPHCAEICRQPGNCDCRPGLVRDLKTCLCVDENDITCLRQQITD